MPSTSSERVRQTLDGLWRIESARLIATIARMLGDIGLAEEVAQDSVIAAMEAWPQSSVPDNPAAWLMTTAKRRAIDLIRQRRMQAEKLPQLGYEAMLLQADRDMSQTDVEDDLKDDLLRLIFTACHPILSAEARVTLTLKMLAGLSTADIARAFLTQESTILQRITRAKRSLSAAQVPFELPQGEQRQQRLGSVLEVIYLMFNEGYAATSGAAWTRPTLCEEAMRLGRMLCELNPDEPEVHGLTALMELQASRLAARVDARGEPILLLAQHRGRWDQLLIRRGLQALQCARQTPDPLGRYTLQAAIAACHASARRAEDTDWIQISALYDALAQQQPGPIVELNRAVACSMAYGADTGLALLNPLLADSRLQSYALLHSVHGDLLEKLGRHKEAANAFQRAAGLTQNESEKKLMRDRANANLPGSKPDKSTRPAQ